jgi:hypothetical protein
MEFLGHDSFSCFFNVVTDEYSVVSGCKRRLWAAGAEVAIGNCR